MEIQYTSQKPYVIPLYFLKGGWQRNLFVGIYFPEYFYPVKKKNDESHDMACLEFVNKTE